MRSVRVVDLCRSLVVPEATEPGGGFSMYNSAGPEDPVSALERRVSTRDTSAGTQTPDEEEALRCFTQKVDMRHVRSLSDRSKEIKGPRGVYEPSPFLI